MLWCSRLAYGDDTICESVKKRGRLPNLACCNSDFKSQLNSQRCLFTSLCNGQGVCCVDPFRYAEYKAERQMAQAGQCCEIAPDCASQICLGGACRDRIDH